MPLNIDTFRNDVGGSAVYKALSHPLAAPPAHALLAKLAAADSLAIYDPDGIAAAFDAFYPLTRANVGHYFVQNVEHLSRRFRELPARPVTEIAEAKPAAVFVASFEPERRLAAIRHLLPGTAEIFSFESLKLPPELQTDKGRYLSPLNFATNFAFFRDEAGHRTRLTTANYWTRYGATEVSLWCRLFGAEGETLATWTETCGTPESSIVIDSRDVRARFALPAFTGQLFIHAVGAAGHDIVKYALDTFGDDGKTCSATHDANSWPADLYAGLPAPADDEDVILWLQNSHPAAIPARDFGFARMGAGEIARIEEPVAPFATRAVRMRTTLPSLSWPDQIEIHAGKHVVRPRYEVMARNGRSRIAHPNVERTDLTNDPGLATLSCLVGKGHILPAPLLPRDRYTSEVLPTPMSTAQRELAVKALVFDSEGNRVAEHRFGRLPRDHRAALDVLTVATELKTPFGHFELVYDFDSGREADGWLHALFRYRNRASGHAAETSFGSHMFNLPVTYRGEPQSYGGPAPGLSTRLFLRIAPKPWQTFCHLIYPVSQSWHAQSQTTLTLRNENGEDIARAELRIPASGSRLWPVEEMFADSVLARAGANPYIIVRDETCRLFGYHGVEGGEGSFSLDHMFGF
ncbi:MAG TPA: hypothetical protein VHT03_10835 [Rhizomicrobium sp.]|jgi:hypothetical protein|nr:hypothetical protein [Rhizomicrobium sp.]